jgi:mannitol operon repressor
MVSEDLRRKYPNLQNFWPYLELLHKESDRGKVLISAGFLERQLKDILLAFMLDNPEAADLVGGHNAPLGTFSARITACYVLGLITENEHGDLNHIRRIRNDFAHNIHTTFQTPSVADRCKELRHKAHDYTSLERGEVKVDAAGQFTTAAVGLIMNFTNRPHYVGKRRCASGAWAY